eukprot:scaffold3965_cov154-Skeletonema_marinoi.AAC.2
MRLSQQILWVDYDSIKKLYPSHLSGQFFRAVLSHPNYNKSAWQDVEEHPDPTRKLAIFLDVDTCL